MKKIICDRCGKEIESPTYIRYTIEQLYTISQRIIWNDSLDLYRDCQQELDAWLKGDKKEEK